MFRQVRLEGQEKIVNKGAGSWHPTVGARLRKFWQAWEKRSVLREGYRIPFVNNKLPPLSPHPRQYTSYLGSPEKVRVLQKEVKEMLEKEAIERVVAINPGFYNRLF